MPRRRKVEVKERTTPAATPERFLEGEESLGNPEGMSTPQQVRKTPSSSQDVEFLQSVNGRSLRPRKSTCYRERDSPEIEERAQKIPRKRRRVIGFETATSDKEGQADKVKLEEKTKNELPPSIAPKYSPNAKVEKVEVAPVVAAKQTPAAAATAIPPPDTDKPEQSAFDKPPASSVSVPPKEDANKTATGTTDAVADKKPKRPRKRPVKKLPVDAEVEGVPKVIAKIEPASPPKKLQESECTLTSLAILNLPPILKPIAKKRIRTKKPKPIAEKTDETKNSSEVKPILDEKIVKKESIDAHAENANKVESSESKAKAEEGAAGTSGESVQKENDGIPPVKKPVKRRPRTKKVSGGDATADSSAKKADSEAPIKVEPKDGDPGKEKSEESETAFGENDSTTTENPAVKKKVTRRPKKIPVANPTEAKAEHGHDEQDAGGTVKPNEAQPTNSEVAASTSGAATTAPEDAQSNKENVAPASSSVLDLASLIGIQPPSAPPITRRPGFFRGRRSKSSLSSRTGKKEAIHIDEPIDPQDIQGFEHVERYVTPPGVKLGKFWDSEDELSDDDSSDNFRRIMCGFGANCRVHEVIRPASEIVRRLKELQNTFGASRTLPLFPKREGDAMESESAPSGQDNGENRTVHQIIWHSDPSYFQYASNFP